MLTLCKADSKAIGTMNFVKTINQRHSKASTIENNGAWIFRHALSQLLNCVSDETEQMLVGKSFKVLKASKLKLALQCLVGLWRELGNVKKVMPLAVELQVL